MSKVTLRYTGPEKREFGGKVGTEKFLVPAEAPGVERGITVTEPVAAILLSVKGPTGAPLYEVALGEGRDRKAVEVAAEALEPRKR